VAKQYGLTADESTEGIDNFKNSLGTFRAQSSDWKKLSAETPQLTPSESEMTRGSCYQLLYVYIPQIVDLIWITLRDTKVAQPLYLMSLALSVEDGVSTSYQHIR